MALNESQIKKLLKWYVNHSETRITYLNERKEAFEKNKEWINPEIIKNMPFEELKKHYLDYYNDGTGKKQSINQIYRDRIIRDSRFRETVLYLFDESIPIKKRFDDVCKGERHIEGMNRALTTALLTDYMPDKYCLWNGKTNSGIWALEMQKILKKNKGETEGDVYLRVLEFFKNLRELLPELELDYLDLDLFLHTIAATDEGNEVIERIKNGPSELKIRYFIEKTLKNHNSNKPEEIDEIRYLFEKGIPKYLGKIANDLDNKNEDRFFINGGVGNPQMNSIDSFGYLPNIAIYDKEAKENDRFNINQFYVIYILREDRKGIYLSLNHGQQYMQNILKENGNYKTWFGMESDIRSEASKLREKLGIDHNFYDTMDLGAVNASSAKMYEAASICSKYYTLENLPSEEELVSDFKEFLRLYGSLSSNEPFLTVIEDKNEIKNAQGRFLDILLERADDIISTSKITTFGKVNAYWSNDLGIWFVNRELGLNRYFNGFGINKPDEVNIPIVCEINIPKSGIDKNVAGAFAEDLKGNIYLIHRGNFVGINKNDFLDKYAGESAQIQDGEIKTSAVVISDLNDPKLPEKVRDFVFEVNRIKNGDDTLKFLDYLNNEGFYFEPELIENFLLSLKVKPFVILTGNSGTGKTKIAQLFAQYINPLPKESNEEKYEEIGSINRSVTSYSRKNNGGWRFKPNELNNLNQNEYSDFAENSEDLILELRLNNESIRGKGYIKQEKQSYSEDIQFYLYYYDNSDFYEAINKLGDDTVTIHLLQKINPYENKKYEIVPVGANWTENRHIVGFFNVITEKYQRTKALDLIISSQNGEFNPYFLILDEMNLSHVERYFSDFLSAMESNEAVELHLSKDIKDVPNEIKFYDNLFVIGTVNVDETTYMFSPKVLDRANTIEFPTPSAEGYMNGRTISRSLNGNIEYLEDPLSDIEIRTKSLNELKELFGNANTPAGKLWNVMAIELEEFQNVLKKANFDFGFRVINEMLRFMYVAWVYEGKQTPWGNWQRYFDSQIKQKMLPRIHGSQRTLENALDDLIDLCDDYPDSKAKLEEMNEVLKKQRYVSFTN